MAVISGGALAVLIAAAVIDCGLVAVAFVSFLKQKE